MIDIIEGFERFNDFGMGFIFLQNLVADGDGDGIDGEAGADIRGILLNIINLQPQAADDRNKILQADAVGELQMDFKMIGTVFEISSRDGNQSRAHSRAVKEARATV